MKSYRTDTPVKKLKTITCCIGALLLASCASFPNAQQNATADHGPYPSNYEAIVRNWISTTFFDPHSIQDLTIKKPTKGWMTGAPLFGEKPVTYGWEVVVAANGKNRFGGYVGLQTFDLLIRDGAIVKEVNLSNPSL